MARTIDAIIKEVSSRSDPQRQTIMKQVADIPRQIQAETAGLEAKRLRANDDILGAARDRGVGFGGIPIGEQAQYAATEFAPALARLKTAGVDRRTSLESALSDIGSRDFANAQDIFRDERDFAENARRFQIQQEEAARARAAASRAASAEQNILAKYGIGLGGNPTGGGEDVNQEEVNYQAYLAQQNRLDTAARRKISGTPGLTLRGGSGGRGSTGGLTFQGNSSRPLTTNNPGRLRASGNRTTLPTSSNGLSNSLIDPFRR